VLLDRIVDGKVLNLFLIQIRLYLVKIWKKIKKDWIRSGCTKTGIGLGLSGLAELKPNP
jgi:hypothetical protein